MVQFLSKVKRYQRIGPWLLSLLLATLVLGAGLVKWHHGRSPAPPYRLNGEAPPKSVPALVQWARSGDPLKRDRARYLLAVDSLGRNQPQGALQWLEGLEQTYRPMAAPILLLRAKAYQQQGDDRKAKATWQQLLREYGTAPEAAVALLNLNRPEEAIARFPQHPAVVNYVAQQLEKNPDQVPYLKLVARHGLFLQAYGTYLEILRQRYADQLTPADWEAIAFGYWEKMQYASAAAAYAKAPPTPLNLYRVGRGRQLSEDTAGAIAAYQALIQRFPNSSEAALAQLRLAHLAKTPAARLPLLAKCLQFATQNQAPAIAADALLAQYQAYRELGNTKGAQQTQQQLFKTYPQSSAAAELRWQLAQGAAQKRQWSQAQQWVREILKFNPESELAPQAAFWQGKWQGEAGQPQGQRQTWQLVTERYPHTYYAWRAASLLKKPVGTFTTLRQQRPSVAGDRQTLLPLATGSPTLQELYLLRQFQEAWQRWQWEFQNRVTPTAAEQLTDGLIRLGVGEYLDGIFMLQNLFTRAAREPQVATFLAPLRRDVRFWYALYPLPYWELVKKWSLTHNLNPLLVMALIRQESRFEKDIRSVVGATGLMQLMPETAAWIAEQLNLEDYSLVDPEHNIRLGTWYFDYTHNQYNQNTLLALASYNAGPGNVSQWLERFDIGDSDRFVESIPFPETYGYVKSVLENYWNYWQLYAQP
ncbi:MAG TPA: transglycosylase SLT domain-containing protein [Thermosynechococcus sp. M3746_W2019_013]|uniref:lytic transglycosylase domain-containing protein n=1 Tax=Thermosynechococcus sp. M3746_W2019_013 TaxID=2747806 RepID=UPI0019DF6338|nr:transglycosylase SLT domain-containing protein [Thermosynechococcus sp. M3746_W2019_013]HIK22418.1 transglycosylase SLT domain-containing protein [Thermosynechococcus sp. M3746_W2019_013]